MTHDYKKLQRINLASVWVVKHKEKARKPANAFFFLPETYYSKVAPQYG